MTIALLSIGTELTRGELTNTNAVWLAERLSALGLEVTALETVDDHRERIERSLQRLAAEHSAILCTGGLGPTTDDITTECVARILGVELNLHEPSLAAIRERMARVSRKLAPSNEKQAYFPENASILPNARGTAPGFSVMFGSCQAFFLPGVPHEMHAMYLDSVEPELARAVPDPIVQIVLRTFGMPESSVNDALIGLEQEYGVLLGYRAHFPDIEVKVLARGSDRIATQRKARAAADEVVRRLGDAVYGEGYDALPSVVGTLLAQRKLTLGVAESCTGGLLSALLTDKPGASSYFLGSVISYANSAKEGLLGVGAELLEAHGAVSQEAAQAMARGAQKVLGASLGLAITGIAGPAGGSSEKPVGLVHFALATPDGVLSYHFVKPGDRERVRILAAHTGLNHLREWLLHTMTSGSRRQTSEET